MDDRLQTTCNKSGKHDCRCEEEDASPLSPTIRSNGERKRRRSLPCGPAESPCVTSQPMPLPSLQEHIPQETRDNANPRSSTEMMNNNRSTTRTLPNRSENKNEVRTRNNLNSDHLEHWFKVQLKIEERDGNLEKRCKHTAKEEIVNPKMNVDRIEESYNNSVKNSTNAGTGSGDTSEMTSATKAGGLLDNFAPFAPAVWPFVSSWQNSNVNSKFQSLRGVKETRFNDERSYKPLIVKDALHNASNDPYAQPTPFHESNPGPSTYKWMQKLDNSACTVHQSCSKNVNKIVAEVRVSTGQDALEINKEDNTLKNSQKKTGKSDLGQLMWKLSIPDEKDKSEEGGLLDWFSKVSGRVLGVAATKGYIDGNKAKSGSLKQPEHPAGQQGANEIKFKNCNLELSQREVDEVLAVLRARTPSGRRRSTVKNVRRRVERPERGGDGVEKILAKCASPDEEATRSNSTNRPAGVSRIRALKSCEDCNRGSCKMIDHQIPEEQSSPLDRVYYDKNVYHPTRSKLADRRANRLNEEHTKTGDANNLQNVSTKADVLLGAILRTSKDRKDPPDVLLNGTSPKSTTIVDDDSSDDDSCFSSVDKLDQQGETAGLSNDDKSLPLNKRFHRFRQLFKKEVDKRIAMMAEENPFSSETTPTPSQHSNSALLRYNNEQPNLHNARSSRVKRRIDFVNFPEVTEEKEDAAIPGAKETHQKPRETRITNSNRECDSAGLNNRQNHRDRRLLEGVKESAEDEERGGKKDITILQKNNLATLTTAQNGRPSSKIRNSNHKDGAIAETGDDETVDKSVPSALEQERFRRSLENAASMVFHSRTGLPLTSSPAPLRRGSCCFDYDSSLNSVSSKRKYDL